MNPAIAINIALLPDESGMKAVMALNKELQDQSGVCSHPFSMSTCLPHLTLNMCGILQDDIPLIVSRLQNIIAGHRPVAIDMILRTATLPDGRPMSELAIQPDTGHPVYALHTACMDITQNREIQHLPLEAYVQSADLSLPTVRWTTAFRENCRTNGYTPHITLNIGDLQRSHEQRILCTRIALCQVGNFCTCRQILYEQELTG